MQGQAARPRPLIYTDGGERVAARVVLRGRVHGVGFEEFLAIYARRLDLACRIGEVAGDDFIFDVSGKPELVDMLLTVCWLGPRRALVDAVDVRFSPAQGSRSPRRSPA